jgi:hypothetical protein
MTDEDRREEPRYLAHRSPYVTWAIALVCLIELAGILAAVLRLTRS